MPSGRKEDMGSVTELKKVFSSDGKALGEEWVNLSGLQTDTREAILQIIYLDKMLDIYNDRINEQNRA